MTDRELVQQVRNGNQHACRYLVAKYQGLVNHMVRRILLRNDVAEDICQDVFLKVFSRLHAFRGDAKLSTWIATIAYHTGQLEGIESRAALAPIVVDADLQAVRRVVGRG